MLVTWDRVWVSGSRGGGEDHLHPGAVWRVEPAGLASARVESREPRRQMTLGRGPHPHTLCWAAIGRAAVV